MSDPVHAIGIIGTLVGGALVLGFIFLLIEVGALRLRIEDLERWKNNG